MAQPNEQPKPKTENLVDVQLLADYWPTPDEAALNPDHEAVQLAPPPNPELDPGVPTHTELRFKAGTSAKLTIKSAFRLVEQGKAKRLDWGDAA